MGAAQRSLERSLVLAAPREVVYRALLDPAALSRWMYATVRIQPRKGGAYRIEWQDTTLPASAQGEILEMIEGRRLVLSWFMERDGIETIASFDLEDGLSAEETRLVFRHGAFPATPDWQARFDMISVEWEKTLENLRFLVEERVGDAPLYYQRHQTNLPAGRERAHLQWMGPASLIGWLAREAFVDPAVRGKIELTLEDGTSVHATIRAFVPGKHLRMLWDEGGRRSLIGISFWPTQPGCVMTLTQRSFAIEESERDAMMRLWEGRFSKLRELLETPVGVWTAGGDRGFVVSRTIPAPQAQVWRAWTDPACLVEWFCDRAEVTVRRGNPFAFLWSAYGEARGTVLDLRDGSWLSLGWDFPRRRATTTVDLRLAAAEGDPAKTEVRLEHAGWGTGSNWDAEMEGHRHWWTAYLAALEFYLAHRSNGAPSRFILRRRVPAPVEAVADRLGRAHRDLEASEVLLAEPGEGVAIVSLRPVPAYIEIAWGKDKDGTRVLVTGQAYGASASWAEGQRGFWGERISAITGAKRTETGS